jgi:hypothetical protein
MAQVKKRTAQKADMLDWQFPSEEAWAQAQLLAPSSPTT